MKNIRSFVCILAAQIRKNSSTTFSLSMRIAWTIAKNDNPNNAILTFKKVSGEICRRVVSTNPDLFPMIKGTGRPVKPGLKLFVDLGKYISNKPSVISAYEQNIISIAA